MYINESITSLNKSLVWHIYGNTVDRHVVIAKTEVYFEIKDKSFYEKGIEKLEESWNECITLEGEYVDE